MTAAPPASPGRLTVLYDARCRVCTRIAGRLAALDTERRLRLRPLQRAHVDEWASVRRLRAQRDLRLELHVIDGAGEWASGGEALLRTLERIPDVAPLAALLRLPLLRRGVEPGYRWFAAHRARFAFLAGSFRNRSFGPAKRVGRGQASRAHGGIEAGEGTDGHRGAEPAHHGDRRDDRHPRL